MEGKGKKGQYEIEIYFILIFFSMQRCTLLEAQLESSQSRLAELMAQGEEMAAELQYERSNSHKMMKPMMKKQRSLLDNLNNLEMLKVPFAFPFPPFPLSALALILTYPVLSMSLSFLFFFCPFLFNVLLGRSRECTRLRRIAEAKTCQV